MSLVARGFGLEPTALVGPSIWGFTRKSVVPPPAVTTVDPYAKHANTQVIRESHLKKFLRPKKRKLERVDLETQKVIAAGIVPTSVIHKPNELVGLKTADARHIEQAARVIARIATDAHFVVGDEDMKILQKTPDILKKIH